MAKGGRGKAKGSAYERSVCKRLSLWISHGQSEDLFWRSAMSGGRATVAAKSGKRLDRQAGDISATSREGHALTDFYYVELKAYRHLAIDSFLIKNTGILVQFWQVALREARRYNRSPLLIVKQNNMPELVIMRAGPHTRFSSLMRVLLRTARYDIVLLSDFLAHPYKG